MYIILLIIFLILKNRLSNIRLISCRHFQVFVFIVYLLWLKWQVTKLEIASAKSAWIINSPNRLWIDTLSRFIRNKKNCIGWSKSAGPSRGSSDGPQNCVAVNQKTLYPKECFCEWIMTRWLSWGNGRLACENLL